MGTVFRSGLMALSTRGIGLTTGRKARGRSGTLMATFFKVNL
jgi:hypothetical protein